MRSRAAYLWALVAASLISGPASSAMAAEETPIALPSGLEAHLQETISDQPGSGLVYRFRFVAPEFRRISRLRPLILSICATITPCRASPSWARNPTGL